MEETGATLARKRRRRILILLAVLIGLPLALVGGAYLFVLTPGGSALVKRQVLSALEGALAGKIAVKELGLRGNHLVLTGLGLFTPEGELVASIERVEADVMLGELIRQRVHLQNVKVTKPKLLLVQDERGLNLARAVAAKNASTAAVTEAGRSGWRIVVDDADLTLGLFDLQQEDRRITASAVTATGKADVRLGPLEVTGSLELAARVTAPLEEALTVKVAANTAQGPQAYDVLATLGGTRLSGRLELPALAITIDELVAAPRELSAFLPGWPVKPVVFGKGSLSLRQASLQLTAGKARASVEAKYDLEKSSAERLVVSAQQVDLQELVGASLPSALAFDAKGALSDWRPETLAGSVEVKATWDAPGGKRLAEADIAASAAKGELEVKSADITSPGLSLKARGSGNLKSLSAFGTLRAKDLREVARTLETFAGVHVEGLAGNGTVRISVQGPTLHPAATVVGQLNQFSIAGVQAQLLSLNVDLADVMHPLEADVLLHAQRLSLLQRSFDDVTFDFITHGRELDLDLATRGLGDLRVHALGLLDKDSRGAQLRTVELTSSDSKWVMEQPTHLAWTNGLTVAPFSLREGDQRLSGELVLAGNRLDAKARVENLDLARLPHLVAPPSLRLGGTLDADAVATGKTKRLAVLVNAQLTGGRVKDVTGVDANLKGSWADERAKGALDAHSPLGKVTGTFDLPVLAFLEEKPGDGTAHVVLQGVNTSELEKQLGQKLPVAGQVSGVLDVSGSGDRPDVKASLEAEELTLTHEGQQLVVKDTRLSVFTGGDAKLEATVHFATLGGVSDLSLSTPLTLAALRKQPPTKDELLSLPFTLVLGLEHLALKQLDELRGGHDDELAGSVSLTGTITGTARAPTGSLALSLDEVTYPPLHKASALVTVSTDQQRTRLSGQASLADKTQAIELTASVLALPQKALAALLAPGGNADTMVEALRDAPVEVLGTLRPFSIAQAVSTPEGEKPPTGTVSASFEAHGTLEAPTARVLGSLKDLRFDRVILGNARFDLKSTGTQQSFTVALGGEGRDDFKAKGTTGLDLRLSALRHGLDWRAAPMNIALESRNFDVSFLSGATEILRVVAGRVDLTGTFTGTLGDPHFLGDGAVRDGRLALAGFGDYREIGVALHVDDERFELQKLQASSGAGTLQLAALAVRQTSGSWLLTSKGKSDKFPIVIDDQLQATASLDYVLEGDATSALIDIKKLSLPRVEVALPEVKRKDLQDIQRPGDIIVLRAGSRATLRRKQQARDKVVAQSTRQPLVVRALLEAPRNLWVRSSDVNVELGLSEDFRVEFNDGLRMFGEARVLRGDVEVIGRAFVVQRGSAARFAGPPAQPYVNVSALHVNAREQVKITVSVTGRGTDLGIKASSEPPMPESDIYAVLATGRRNLKTSGGATLSPGQAASVVGQLAASQLKTVIAKKLPIDVFNFDTTDNFEKVKLDVGKYLSDVVYLGGSVDIGAKRERGENVWAGRLELQLTKSVSLEAYAGDALSFGADAMWSRDF